MTYTKLNLANELNDKIKELEAKLQKDKEAFSIVARNLNSGETSFMLVEDETIKPIEYPLEEFAEFLSSRIEKIGLQLEEAATKFEQL